MVEDDMHMCVGSNFSKSSALVVGGGGGGVWDGLWSDDSRIEDAPLPQIPRRQLGNSKGWEKSS